MPKKLRLDLGNLKVQSFVTSLEGDEASKVKAGATNDTMCLPGCSDECTDTEVSCSCYTCDTCDTCALSCPGSCPTCQPKVVTCDPEC
jgi:hypothetical protein